MPDKQRTTERHTFKSVDAALSFCTPLPSLPFRHFHFKLKKNYANSRIDCESIALTVRTDRCAGLG